MSDYRIDAPRYLRDALNAKSISRTQYNYVRRGAVLLDESHKASWLALNDEIFHGRITIVEDGDLIVEQIFALSSDDRVIEVLS